MREILEFYAILGGVIGIMGVYMLISGICLHMTQK
jgi:membrane-bound ClpP family serine protease